MISTLLGGALIGLAAATMLAGLGRIAGISGIVGGTLRATGGDLGWRVWFLVGLVGGGALFALVRPDAFPAAVEPSAPLLVASGLLVGFGTRLGNGCTSGHGVCGLGRFSLRSLVAVLIFMATGALTVFILRHVIGGRP
jgi:uncharacterized protein